MQKQALETLKTAVESSEHPVFPCALIAGDVVILDLLSKLDYLKSGRVTVVFVDTFHLFSETHTFLHQLEVSTWQPLTALANLCDRAQVWAGNARYIMIHSDDCRTNMVSKQQSSMLVSLSW